MAKIVKTQEVEIGLEEVIKLVKKNWNLLTCYFSCHTKGRGSIGVEASLNLDGIGEGLSHAEGLVADLNELEGAIIQIFREIAHQKPYFKNMEISQRITPTGLDVSFDIDITPVIPVYVDQIDIPGPDNPMDPDRTRRAEMLALGRDPNKTRHIGDGNRCGNVLDDMDPEPIPEDGHL